MCWLVGVVFVRWGGVGLCHVGTQHEGLLLQQRHCDSGGVCCGVCHRHVCMQLWGPCLLWGLCWLLRRAVVYHGMHMWVVVRTAYTFGLEKR